MWILMSCSSLHAAFLKLSSQPDLRVALTFLFLVTTAGSFDVAVAQDHALIVTSGSGTGLYTPGTVVNIVASAPNVGRVFDFWMGSPAIADVNAASTTITMPASATSIMAMYKNAPPPTYVLTVNSGSGGGTYTSGKVVNIAADAPPSGQVFQKWEGSPGIKNINLSNTSITIPAADTTIGALYTTLSSTTHVLTVTGGTGSGSYTSGTVVNISSNDPVAGQVFDQWIGGVAIADVKASSTTITMPAEDTAINVAFKTAPLPDNDSPVITSAPAISAASMTVGATLSMTAGATDPNGGLLTYLWNFGDGSTGLGSTVTHIFSTPGIYSLALTISNSNGGSVSTGMTVTIGSANTSPGASMDFNISRFQGSVNFSSKNKDTYSLAGIIPNIVAGFDPSEALIHLDVGGATSSFTLDSKGRAKNDQGAIKLKLKFVSNKTTYTRWFPGGDVLFSVKLMKGDWSTVWNFDPKAAVKNVPTTFNITMNVKDKFDGETSYTATTTTYFSSKSGVGGIFKK